MSRTSVRKRIHEPNIGPKANSRAEPKIGPKRTHEPKIDPAANSCPENQSESEFMSRTSARERIHEPKLGPQWYSFAETRSASVFMPNFQMSLFRWLPRRIPNLWCSAKLRQLRTCTCATGCLVHPRKRLTCGVQMSWNLRV